MEQWPVPWWIVMPCALAILYLGWRRWQRKPERILRPGGLWLFPAVLTAVVLPLLYLQPHKPFHLVDFAIFAAAAVLGAASGLVRARATTLRYDHEQGALMAGFSLSALLFLIPIGFARYISREYLGIGPSAVSHGDARAITAALLFALAMVVAHRLLLYIRARGALDAHNREKD